MSLKSNDQLLKYISPVFFETGTFLGGGVKAALESGFQKVITVELQEYLYSQCVTTLDEEIKQGRVEIHLGNSKELLPTLIKDVDERITFWLDAHIDGGNYVPGVTPNINPCPLYDELMSIKEHRRNDHIIMIDDLRIIGNSERNGYGWGSNTNLETIKSLILDINPDYEFTFEDGVEPNDILVAKIPNHEKKD